MQSFFGTKLYQYVLAFSEPNKCAGEPADLNVKANDKFPFIILVLPLSVHLYLFISFFVKEDIRCCHGDYNANFFHIRYNTINRYT